MLRAGLLFLAANQRRAHDWRFHAMEFKGVDQCYRPHRLTVTAYGMRREGGTVTIDEAFAGSKLAGCTGTCLGSLLPVLEAGWGQGLNLGRV